METASESSFKGMTFGNILFGGITGVGVDAATGAMHEHPPTVTVRLKPAAAHLGGTTMPLGPAVTPPGPPVS